jgi:hypothetical protein
MTTRNPLVRVTGKIVELPAGDSIAGAQSGSTGSTGPTGPSGTNGANASQYTTNIGDGASTVIAVVHNLGTKNVTVTVIKNSDDSVLNDPTWVATDVNTVTFTFSGAPTSSQYRVIILAGNSTTGAPPPPTLDLYFI